MKTNLENTVVREASHSQRPGCGLSLFVQMPRSGRPRAQDGWFLGGQVWAEEWLPRGAGCLWSDGNVLRLDAVNAYINLKTIKASELYTLKGGFYGL